jgi:hypothetical protein
MKKLINKILNQETLTEKEYIQAHLYLPKMLCSSKRELAMELASDLHNYNKEGVNITIGGIQYVHKY